MVCPRCHGKLVVAEQVSCASCGRVGHLLGHNLVVFDTVKAMHGDWASAIAAWPEDLVRTLPTWAEDLANGNAPTDPGLRQQLCAHQLTDDAGALTALGHNVGYHLDEFRWQQGRRGLDGLLTLDALGQTPRILDVGCGAGQTLRRLEPDRPVQLYGVDIDAAALALGSRLARAEGIELTLAASSARALPFPDGVFDLVMTRVALNYMHQRSALTEMVRVLRPGGYLFCRVENIWHDLLLLKNVPGLKSLVCRFRDLGWGALHALTGWQPAPGGRWRCGRAFASAYRLRQILSGVGCRAETTAASPNGPQLSGRRTQLIVIGRRECTIAMP